MPESKTLSSDQQVKVWELTIIYHPLNTLTHQTRDRAVWPVRGGVSCVNRVISGRIFAGSSLRGHAGHAGHARLKSQMQRDAKSQVLLAAKYYY